MPMDDDIERRRRFVGLRRDDLTRIKAARDVVLPRVDDYVAAFFDYISGFEESAGLLGKPNALSEAKRLKREHLVAMMEGDYGPSYVEQRRRLGTITAAPDWIHGFFLAPTTT
jgi:rsbT co-antagonist protein RsbR